MMTADEIIATLNLAPHPEGGHYRQTWAAQNTIGGPDDRPPNDRPTATCIYFLLREGEASHWHRVDAAELWLYHAGAPLILSLAATDTGPATDHVLGPDLASGAQPQLIVPEDHWQMARSTADWTLVSCVVSPGFTFDGFTLAAPGFDIPRSGSDG